MYGVRVKIVYPNELYHHGVKGMRWGVRKDKETKRYDKDFGETNTLKKGSKMYRVTVNKNEANSGNKYLTYYQSDRNFYRGKGQEWIKYTGKSNVAYEKQYIINKDLKIATSKDVAKALNELAKKDPKMNEKSAQAYADFLIQNMGIKDTKTLNGMYNAAKSNKQLSTKQAEKFCENMMGKESWKKACSDKSEKEYYVSYMKEYGDRYSSYYKEAGNYINKSGNIHVSTFVKSAGMGTDNGKYVKNKLETYLKENGFHGMSDIAGMGGAAGWNREARQTMIVFDTDKNLSERKTKRISSGTQARATRKHNKWKRKTKDHSSLILS